MSLPAAGMPRAYRRWTGINHPAELQGQISINELLDEPIAAEPIQLALPIHFHVPRLPKRQGP